MQQKEAKRLNMLHNILTLKLIFIQVSEFHYTFFCAPLIHILPDLIQKKLGFSHTRWDASPDLVSPPVRITM